MHDSLERIAGVGPEAKVYCGHEYTEANLRFAKHVEPKNAAIDRAMDRVRALRAEGRPSVPSTIGEEREVNPFLRATSLEIRATLDVAKDADDVTAFAAIRTAKDGFRG
jgi:hydroxyacylglutathione hydrolase